MKLSAARECYYSHSGNASSAARQIAFAGIAVVWVFNRPQEGGNTVNLPEELVGTLLLLCIVLACDLLQYTFSAAAWGAWSRFQEKRLKHQFHKDPDVEPPASLNWLGLMMFWSKLAVLLWAFVCLGLFLASAFVSNSP